MTKCPICSCTEFNLPRTDLMPHPYLSCNDCGVYFQPVLPEKVYESSAEVAGDLMGETEKNINKRLAAAIMSYYKEGNYEA